VAPAPLVTIDVLPAKVAEAGRGEQPVGGVDVVHVIHETEWSIGQDLTVTLQECDGLIGKLPNLVHAGLGTTVEVLASKLGDTDGFPETSPLVDVGLEVLELDVVPVNGHLIDVAVTAALVKEVGHPGIAIGGRGGRGASESVTLVGERPDVLIPSTDSIADRGVSLGWLVDLVETEDVRSITRLSEAKETIDLVLGGTPEHDADGDASILDCGRDLRIPKMEHLDSRGGGKEGDPLVIAHSPSDSELSRAAGSVGSRLGRNGLGRLSGRRGGGRVVLGGIVVGRAVVVLGGSAVGGIGLGSASWLRGAACVPGLASLGTTLLLGDAVVVGELPGQVVRLDREGKGLGRSERAEDDSERGERKDVE